MSLTTDESRREPDPAPLDLDDLEARFNGHATEPGTWVWHCHILPHAENEHGMFGMVTALVVQ
jgi:FtsP/CotA-like multicopper oxidase with cupredoxin domain